MADTVQPTSSELATIRDRLRRELPRLAEEYHVATLGIFGSYVRHEQHPGSDLDLLVTFSRPLGLLRFSALANSLSDLLGLRVDLVMKSALKPRIGERILAEVMAV
ncbi:MAG: nucleotidyltransferase family protein [Thermoanaerobaculia bacterium]|nr:nucleotidyltransferase family protein [Thermoanaerobaculia bacterium]